MKIEGQVLLRRGAFTLDLGIVIEDRVTGLFGPSGSGKTTLVHVIGGLLKADAARITFDGEIMQDSSRGIFVPAHRRRVGIVFQEARLFPHLTVRGNLEYGYRRIAPALRQFHLPAVVELMELGPLLDRWPRQLSGGECQRVALGRSILASPRLLLLDEPMASLDSRLRRHITPFLRRIRDATEIPILYVSHDPRDVLDLTDRFAVLDRGRLLGHGPLVDLVADARILDSLERDGLASALPLTVEDHAPEQGITTFRLDASSMPRAAIRGPILDVPVGARVHAELRPEDVTLAVGEVSGISMQNQVPGRIVRLTETPTREVCVVDIGVPLIVEITRPARQSLGLEVGSPVWCLFKARALRYHDA